MKQIPNKPRKFPLTCPAVERESVDHARQEQSHKRNSEHRMRDAPVVVEIDGGIGEQREGIDVREVGGNDGRSGGVWRPSIQPAPRDRYPQEGVCGIEHLGTALLSSVRGLIACNVPDTYCILRPISEMTFLCLFLCRKTIF